MPSDTSELVERLESHMGAQNVSVLLRDCRLAAAAIRRLTPTDTDTAIPAGWKQALEAIAINSNCDWDEVRKHPAKHIDLIHTLAVDALYAASPKPDTDTPVDPGVEGVRS